MSKSATTIVTLGTVLTLAGCVTGATRTTYHTDNPFGFLAHSASRGIVPVVVAGDPYPGRRADVEQAAVAAMDANFASLGRPFRAMPPAPGEGTKVVFLFASATASTLSHAICADPARAASGSGGGPTMTLKVVYCGVGPYSDYWMSFPAPPAPDSPAFQMQLREVAHYAIPREINPERQNSSATPPL